MNELIDRGVVIIMVFLEFSEVFGMSDCILVVYEGKIIGELISEEVI